MNSNKHKSIITGPILFEVVLVLIALLVSLILFFQRFPLSFTNIFDAIPISFIHKGEGAFWPIITSDPLQMSYLTWAAGNGLGEARSLLSDPHQFANLIENFYPMVADPLVYLGGFLSLFSSLAFAYNTAFIIVPHFVFSVFIYATLRVIKIGKAVAFGFAILSPLMPFRLYLLFQAQHIGASAFLLPIYFLGIALFFVRPSARMTGSVVIGLTLLLMGLSEEHLAYSAAFFFWPFLILYFVSIRPASWSRPHIFTSLKTLLRETWPILTGILLFVTWGYIQFKLLTDLSLAKRFSLDDQGNPDFLIIMRNSVDYSFWFEKPFGFTSVLSCFLLLGCGFSILRILKKNAGSVDYFVFTTSVVFWMCSLLAVGHIPWLAEHLHWQPYHFFFKHMPLFSLQRFPQRMSFVGFTSGLIIAAYGLYCLLSYIPKNRTRLHYFVSVSVAVLLFFTAQQWIYRLGEGQYFNLTRDPYPDVHQIIRNTAGHQNIVLRLPARTAATFEDTRVLLNIIHTDAHFFNGYFSHVPKIYAENYSLFFPNMCEDGLVNNELADVIKKVGIRYFLIDREFVDIDSEGMRKLVQNPKITTLLKTPEFLYLKINL